VRGLDYYSHTAFEFVTDRLGAQGTVMAGGRYNGLVEEMGGPPTPAVGWAAGMERLAMLLPEAPEAPRAVAVIPAGEGAEGPAIEVLRELREAGVAAEIGYRGNLKRRMERANKSGAFAAVIIGEAEIVEGNVVVRDLLEGTQDKVPRDQLLRALAETTGGLDAMEDVIAEMMAAQMLDESEGTP
jgi:histidyl-tRNA synthetase